MLSQWTHCLQVYDTDLLLFSYHTLLIKTLQHLSLLLHKLRVVSYLGPLCDNYVWQHVSSGCQKRYRAFFFFKLLCSNHSHNCKNKKSICLHLKSSKPSALWKKTSEHTHSSSNILLSTHTPPKRPWISAWEATREEWVDRQELNSHSDKREASALKQG